MVTVHFTLLIYSYCKRKFFLLEKQKRFVKLKGVRKMCSSKMLEIADSHDEIDYNCNDYQIIRRYLS